MSLRLTVVSAALLAAPDASADELCGRPFTSVQQPYADVARTSGIQAILNNDSYVAFADAAPKWCGPSRKLPTRRRRRWFADVRCRRAIGLKFSFKRGAAAQCQRATPSSPSFKLCQISETPICSSARYSTRAPENFTALAQFSVSTAR
jgi:hypothetical protein